MVTTSPRVGLCLLLLSATIRFHTLQSSSQSWAASAFQPSRFSQHQQQQQSTCRISTSTCGPLAFVGPNKKVTATATFVGATTTTTTATTTTRLYSSSSSSTDEYMLDANDVELLQKVFSKYADQDGLMTKADVKQVPAIAQLLVDGDILEEELSEIWDKSPKFPDVDIAEERIDVDSFVQVYRAIDDLFEDEEEKDGDEVEPASSAPENDISEEESELVDVFASIANDGFVTKNELLEWDEIVALIEDKMLGKDEYDQLWKDACGSKDKMDEDGFLKFNDLLDSLFEFDDENLDEIIEDSGEVLEDVVKSKAASEESSLEVVEGDVEPEELFVLLKSPEGVVGVAELKRWGELQEMIADGDISTNEVDEIFENALSVSQEDESLDQAGFTFLCKAIDDLFEEFDDEEEPAKEERTSTSETTGTSSLKDDLFRVLEVMNSDGERLPCGLESTEREEELILDLVTEIEKDNTNLVRLKDGNVELSDLAGEWEMLYTSSSAMKFNKGLSGIGGSFPNGRFGGLKQTLKATSVMSDVEYSEFIDVNPSSASFDVKVNGNWDLRRSVSLFTGDPSVVLAVEPDRVTYGPTSTRADHWKSLGPMNMLDVTYLDDDIRIMRGNTAVDTIFIFKRLK